MGSAEHPIEPAPRFAIVGYAARFPGAPDADAFWDLLREEVLKARAVEEE